METNNTVAIWVGNFESDIALDDYIELKYDEEGEIVASDFFRDYKIDLDDIDEDFIEKTVVDDRVTDIRELIHGASYEEFIIKSFTSTNVEFSIKESNTIILVYNYTYDGNVKTSSYIDFFTNVEYR